MKQVCVLADAESQLLALYSRLEGYRDGWNIGLFYAIEGDRIMIRGALDLRQSPENIRKQLGLI